MEGRKNGDKNRWCKTEIQRVRLKLRNGRKNSEDEKEMVQDKKQRVWVKLKNGRNEEW